MKTYKFNSGDFMEWFEEAFGMDNHYAVNAAANVIKYGKSHLKEEEIPGLLASILPGVTEEEAVKFLKTEIVNLPDGYAWKHYEDGSGSILGPDGKNYFCYDRQTFGGNVEYQRNSSSSWNVYWDGFESFKRYAEKSIREGERIEIHSMIVEDYTNHDAEFSTSFLNFLTDLSLLDAVELYADLQYTFNKDYVCLVKDAVIDDDKIIGGVICSFDTIFSSEDRIPGKRLTELLEIAEEKAKEAGGLLIRADWLEVSEQDDNVITDGETMCFLF